MRPARPVAAPTASATQPTHSRPRDDAVCSAMCGVRPSDTTIQLVAALGEVAERLRRPVERQHYEDDRPVHRRARALQAQRRSSPPVGALSGTGGASTMTGACHGQIRDAGRSYLTLAAVPLRRETLMDVCGCGCGKVGA